MGKTVRQRERLWMKIWKVVKMLLIATAFIGFVGLALWWDKVRIVWF